ncbi:MAG: flavodoxin [Candidatus Thermoplasmatota archaeon]|nr:flavodoxin [Candidatus Thermoplasmatota archaeon]
MHQVLYFSRSGNTRKVADMIAEELGVSAEDISKAAVNKESGVIFLGSGCYGGKPSPKMLRFIEANDFENRQVALFGTSGGGLGNELQEMADALNKKDAHVQGRYACKGKTFGLFNRGHPTQEELAAAKDFARQVVQKR